MLRAGTDIKPGMDISEDDSDLFTLEKYWHPILRQRTLVFGITAAFVALATLYVLTATPMFTSSGLIFIRTQTSKLFDNEQTVADAPIDSPFVDSQVEVIKSESVLLSVIRSLKLTEDPEFNGAGASFVEVLADNVMALFDSAPDSGNKLERKAIEVMTKNLTAKRVELTYLIEIDFKSEDPQKSARIANAIMAAYVTAQNDANYEVTRKASSWLQGRLDELRSQAMVADEAVRAFKAANNLVDTSHGLDSSHGLIAQQQLADVNQQLILAQAATAEAKAKLDRINDVNKDDVPDANISDALSNEVIQRLRSQYLYLRGREAEFSVRYGYNHIAVINLRNQMSEIKHSIKDEVNRIAQAYTSDYEIAIDHQKLIEANLAKLVSENAGTGKAQAQLRDLESTAQSARRVYDSFLLQSAQAVQQQTFPTGEARIVTTATAPVNKTSPKTLLILFDSVVVGLFAGAMTVLFREQFNNSFRTTAGFEEVTGLDCLGVLPEVSSHNLAQAIPGPGRILPAKLGIYRYVSEAPFSRFTETLRAVKLALAMSNQDNPARVIGIVSSIPHEGKTVVATNFAALLAQGGIKTILIDADLRSPSLSKNLAGETNQGLLAAMQNPKQVSELLWHDPVAGFDFLPAETTQPISHSSEVLASQAMSRLLASLRESYSYIIIDLPPITPVVDVLAISHIVDKFALVVEWGETSKSAVMEALATVEGMRDKLVGAVLNKASAKSLKSFEEYKGSHYQTYYVEPDRTSI